MASPDMLKCVAMAKQKRPFFKQKPVLYFDENCPEPVVEHFRTNSYWKKKVKVLSAVEEGNKGQPDGFHFGHCKRNAYTLVTLDGDFNNDRLYPFAFGTMPGVIMIKETKSQVQRIVRVLSSVLDFVLRAPFPRRSYWKANLSRAEKVVLCAVETLVPRK